MKKLILALVLTSTFAFGINPKKVAIQKRVFAEKKAKIKTIEEEASPCLDRALFIMDFLMDVGFSLEFSSQISDAVYHDCVNNGYNRK